MLLNYSKKVRHFLITSNFLSTITFFDFLSSGIVTPQDPTKNRSSMGPSDSSIGGIGRSILGALLKPECSLHLAAFNIRLLNQVG